MALTQQQRDAMAKGAREHEELERAARGISERTRVPVSVSPPFDFEAANRGKDPFHRDTWRKTRRGQGYIPITCRLGAHCETWLIAASRLAGEMGLEWRAELPPSRELSFQVKYPLKRAAEVADAFRRLAAKFDAHQNVYYDRGEPWGMDVSKTVYFHD